MKAIAIIKQISLLLVMLLLVRCAVASSPHESNHYQRDSITGYAQIGPFLEGGRINIQEFLNINDSLNGILEISIINNLGGYAYSLFSSDAEYATFETDGRFYNIIKGRRSRPIRIRAFVDLKADTTANINVLTHMEEPRVRYLVQNHQYTLIEARQKAQSEVLSVFGFKDKLMPPSHLLDINGKTEADGILLAISLIVMSDNKLFSTQELLNVIASEILVDGKLNSTHILGELRKSVMGLDYEEITTTLYSSTRLYSDNVYVPFFENHINSFVESINPEPFVLTKTADHVGYNEATLVGEVYSHGSETKVYFEYGRMDSEVTRVMVAEQLTEEHDTLNFRLMVEDLLPQTFYSFTLIAENEHNVSQGNTESFLTKKDSKSHFGFYLGMNTIGFSIRESEKTLSQYFSSIESNNSVGMHLSVFYNHNLTDSWDLRIAFRMLLGERHIEYFSLNQQDKKQDFKHIVWSIPLSLKYSFTPYTSVKPYIIGGLGYSFDMGSNEKRNSDCDPFLIRTKQNDVIGEFGLGATKKFNHFYMSVEATMGYGFINLLSPGDNNPSFYNAIDHLRSRGLMFSLIFE